MSISKQCPSPANSCRRDNLSLVFLHFEREIACWAEGSPTSHPQKKKKRRMKKTIFVNRRLSFFRDSEPGRPILFIAE